ncbi:MAG: hypothetical protein JWO60_1377 [Frankiales bacterium]|nr:hypothetical protein [Frankiales bacterium]
MMPMGPQDGDPDDDALYDDEESDHLHQDPVLSLHDTGEEAGDEIGLVDLYRMDTLEAEQLHVDLDSTGGQEALLD